MAQAGYIAGDWGTTRLRLALCDAAGEVLELREGQGVASCAGGYAAYFDELVAPWRATHGPVPAVLCGMIGADIGWATVPYVPCPARPQSLAEHCLPVAGGAVRIVPGLRCRNRLGAPDFLRGEETQMLGALRLEPGLDTGRHLLCLPGTHTKWAVLHDGAIAEFQTAPTGELYALLRDHSVLLRGAAEPADAATGFALGLARVRAASPAQLLNLLFEARGRRLAGEDAGHASAAFLSGLLIGADVLAALQLYAEEATAPASVTLIGAPALTGPYAQALGASGVSARRIDGAAASLAGLGLVQGHLASVGVRHDA